MSTPKSRLELLMKLISIPSITASAQEDLAARFIYDWLTELGWFKEHPHYLTLLPTPLEGNTRPLHALTAFITAAKPTKRTIILIGHLDVVDTGAYSPLEDIAFDPQALVSSLETARLDPCAAADLVSGNFLFGRGSMDMKCGVAVELELLRDFSENRALFDVNLLLVLVPDEENVSAGMRGAIPWLLELQQQLGLDYLAAVNAEPTEAGLPTAVNPVVFLGTVGKLMPVFLCLGRESHVGAYYEGLNAALLSARIVTLAEGNPDLADPAMGVCCPSWICLEQKILRENYSVTVPGAAVAYFNCYLESNTPATVLDQMLRLAAQAAAETVAQLRKSRTALIKLGLPVGAEPDWEVKICRVAELWHKARSNTPDVVEKLEAFWQQLAEPDPRTAAIAAMRELARLAGEDGPLIVCGFLPPYYPPASSLGAGVKRQALARAADDLIAEARRLFGVSVEKYPFFTGLCDLSYFGFDGELEELAALENNMPGWGRIYSLPVSAMTQLNLAVANFGPSGKDPHKKTERLEKKFSLERYPVLLEYLIRSISRENV